MWLGILLYNLVGDCKLPEIVWVKYLLYHDKNRKKGPTPLSHLPRWIYSTVCPFSSTIQTIVDKHESAFCLANSYDSYFPQNRGKTEPPTYTEYSITLLHLLCLFAYSACLRRFFAFQMLWIYICQFRALCAF